MVKKHKVCIIGSEGWGTAIATAVGMNVLKPDFDKRVHMYVYDELVRSSYLSEVINEQHENIKYLPGIELPANVIAINDLLETAEHADILIFATSHEFVRTYCNLLAGNIKKNAIALTMVKGLERNVDGNIELYSSIISQQLDIPCYSLMSANSAMEMAQGKLCEMTVGCNNTGHADLIKDLLETRNCKVVNIHDVEGVELCGSLKDIISLGAGLIDGLRLGDNARVTALHLGLKEMMRFTKTFYPNAKLSTFYETCGVTNMVASSFADKNVMFAKKFVTSGKTIQELESSLLRGKKLLGPILAAEVNAFLQNVEQTDKFPLFTAIHKICQNMEPVETILKVLRHHPDLKEDSISKMLTNEAAAESAQSQIDQSLQAYTSEDAWIPLYKCKEAVKHSHPLIVQASTEAGNEISDIENRVWHSLNRSENRSENYDEYQPEMSHDSQMDSRDKKKQRLTLNPSTQMDCKDEHMSKVMNQSSRMDKIDPLKLINQKSEKVKKHSDVQKRTPDREDDWSRYGQLRQSEVDFANYKKDRLNSSSDEVPSLPPKEYNPDLSDSLVLDHYRSKESAKLEFKDARASLEDEEDDRENYKQSKWHLSDDGVHSIKDWFPEQNDSLILDRVEKDEQYEDAEVQGAKMADDDWTQVPIVNYGKKDIESSAKKVDEMTEESARQPKKGAIKSPSRNQSKIRSDPLTKRIAEKQPKDKTADSTKVIYEKDGMLGMRLKNSEPKLMSMSMTMLLKTSKELEENRKKLSRKGQVQGVHTEKMTGKDKSKGPSKVPSHPDESRLSIGSWPDKLANYKRRAGESPLHLEEPDPEVTADWFVDTRGYEEKHEIDMEEQQAIMEARHHNKHRKRSHREQERLEDMEYTERALHDKEGYGHHRNEEPEWGWTKHRDQFIDGSGRGKRTGGLAKFPEQEDLVPESEVIDLEPEKKEPTSFLGNFMGNRETQQPFITPPPSMPKTPDHQEAGTPKRQLQDAEPVRRQTEPKTNPMEPIRSFQYSSEYYGKKTQDAGTKPPPTVPSPQSVPKQQPERPVRSPIRLYEDYREEQLRKNLAALHEAYPERYKPASDQRVERRDRKEKKERVQASGKSKEETKESSMSKAVKRRVSELKAGREERQEKGEKQQRHEKKAKRQDKDQRSTNPIEDFKQTPELAAERQIRTPIKLYDSAKNKDINADWEEHHSQPKSEIFDRDESKQQRGQSLPKDVVERFQKAQTTMKKFNKRLQNLLGKGVVPEERKGLKRDSRESRAKTTKVTYDGSNPYSDIPEPPNPDMERVDDHDRMDKKKKKQKVMRLKPTYYPPINPRMRIPRPPFDGSNKDFHTIACHLQPPPPPPPPPINVIVSGLLLNQGKVKAPRRHPMNLSCSRTMSLATTSSPIRKIPRCYPMKLICLMQLALFTNFFKNSKQN